MSVCYCGQVSGSSVVMGFVRALRRAAPHATFLGILIGAVQVQHLLWGLVTSIGWRLDGVTRT